MGYRTWELVALIAALSGCASPMKPFPAPSPPVPAALLQPCPPLPLLEGMTGADVLQEFIAIGRMYNDCADSKSALIGAVK